MKLLNDSSEDDVILEYLKSENGEEIIQLSPSERRILLGEKRGYGRNLGLFYNFPTNIKWFNAYFTFDDLKKVLYINYDVWNNFSNNSRLSSVAANNIKNKINFNGICAEKIQSIAQAIQERCILGKLILITDNENSPVVVIEGHHRLTAYMVESKIIKEGLDVFIGFSTDIKNWNYY